MRHRVLWLVGLLASGSASAGDGHDRALAARQAGEIASLDEILAVVAERTPGRVLEVELKQRERRYIYEIEVLTPAGLIVETYVDARDKRILDSHLEDGEHD
jgi:uncharacterized membrane protein YkoI